MLSSFKIRNQLLILFFLVFSRFFYLLHLPYSIIDFGYCYFLKKLEKIELKKCTVRRGHLWYRLLFWLFTLDSISILDIRKTFYTCTFYTNNISNIDEFIFWISAILIYLTRRINPDLRFLKISLVSVILFSSEWVRSFLFGGLPLSLTAHIWSFQYQLISIASYIGVFGLSYLTIYWLVLISSFYNKKAVVFS